MKNYKGNMLLIELVIVILFFSLSSAVVLQVFARAQQTNSESRIASNALMAAENAAETLALSDEPEQTLEQLGFAAEENGVFVLTADIGYRLMATVSRLSQGAGTLITVDLQALRGTVELFTLPATRYMGVNPA